MPVGTTLRLFEFVFVPLGIPFKLITFVSISTSKNVPHPLQFYCVKNTSFGFSHVKTLTIWSELRNVQRT